MDPQDFRQGALNATAGLLGIFICSLLAYCVVRLFASEILPNNREILALIIGVLLRELSTFVQYLLGSSSQAKKQADTIDKLAATAKTTAETAQTAQAGANPAPSVTLGPNETVTVAAEPANGSPADKL